MLPCYRESVTGNRLDGVVGLGLGAATPALTLTGTDSERCDRITLPDDSPLPAALRERVPR